MGAAESKNVADAVANVVNSVSQSTTADTAQIDKTSQTISLNNCYIGGNLNAKEQAEIMVKNTQILKAQQDTNLKNNIQQQMLQSASSTVGSLGVGYADASNSVNTMVNTTNTIINSMNAGALQFSNVDNKFICDNSTIVGNVNLDFSSSKNFLSSQTLDNTQVSTVVNDITQTIQQKATATVEGLGGFLIALAILIGAIGWALSKPLTTGPMKIMISFILFVLIGSLIVFAYIKSLPPFFSKGEECISGSEMGKGGNNVDCVDYQDGNVKIDGPPLRYVYGLTPGDQSRPGGNLLQMAVSVASGQSVGSSFGDNGGYRIDTMQNLDNSIKGYSSLANSIGVPNIPNPLYNPTNDNTKFYTIPSEYMTSTGKGRCTPGTVQYDAHGSDNVQNCPNKLNMKDTMNTPALGVANLNTTAWDNYLNMISPTSSGGNDTQQSRTLFARFVLSDIIAGSGNLDTHIYVDGNEPVKFRDDSGNVITGLAKDYPDYTYKFVPDGAITNYRNGVMSGGSIQGPVGRVNSTMYKFSKFMRNIGIWITVAFFIIAMGIIFFYKKKQESK
jgi:hypothetical protein